MKQTLLVLSVFLMLPSIGVSQVSDDCAVRLEKAEDEVKVLSKELEDHRRDSLAWFFKTFRPTNSLVWMCDDNAEFVQPVAPIEDPSVEVAARAFNHQYSSPGDPQIGIRSVDQNRLIVVVENSDRLTQGMGSSGAACFLASATFTLTSVPGVDFVQFEFEEGDHAYPGTYGRASYPWLFPKLRR